MKPFLLGFLLAYAMPTGAVPVELVIDAEPCVEKTLVTKITSKAKGQSPILAWVTVRSGGPIRDDAPRCIDETMVIDLPTPLFETFETFEPESEYSVLDIESTEPVQDAPPRGFAPPWHRWYGWAPAGRYVSPSPRTAPPAPTPVPEPASLWLFALALGALWVMCKNGPRPKS